MRFFVSLERAGATFLYQHMLMDDTVQPSFLSWGSPSWKVIFSQEFIKYEGIIMTPPVHNRPFKKASY